MERDEVLRSIMRHAVGGHNSDGFNTFCNDPQHAMTILSNHQFVMTRAFSRSQERRLDAQLESEAVDRFVSEGGTFAPR